MSNRALNWAFELPIRGATKSILIALANHAAADGTCFPSMPRIALFAGLSDRGARKAIRELEELGLVSTVHATGHRSRYKLSLGAKTPERVPPPPRNHVPPNLHLTINEPSGNLQESAPTVSRHDGDGAEPEASARSAAPNASPAPRTRKHAPAAVDPAWRPAAAGVEYARRHGVLDLETETEAFRDWHLSYGATRADYAAAWRTWCRKHKQFAQQRSSPTASNNAHGGAMLACGPLAYACPWSRALEAAEPWTGAALPLAIVAGRAFRLRRARTLSPADVSEILQMADCDLARARDVVAAIEAGQPADQHLRRDDCEWLDHPERIFAQMVDTFRRRVPADACQP